MSFSCIRQSSIRATRRLQEQQLVHQYFFVTALLNSGGAFEHNVLSKKDDTTLGERTF
jgi:hypothetical protein